MTNAQRIARDKARELNLKIRNQLIANGIIISNGRLTGKQFEDVKSEEWVAWIKELIGLRDQYLIESEA